MVTGVFQLKGHKHIRRPKRPREVNQLAKSIVDIATGELQDEVETAELSPEQKLGRDRRTLRREGSC